MATAIGNAIGNFGGFLRRFHTRALALSLLIGCTDPVPRTTAVPSGITVTDSADIQIVHVGGQVLDGLPEWSISEEPIRSIGVRTGEAPYMFGDITGALRLSSGEIVIVDGHDFQFRVFGPDGVFRRAFGREGEGPGEFKRVVMRKLLDGGFAVFDDRLDRVTIFDDQGAIVSTRSTDCGSGDTGSFRTLGLVPCYFGGLTGDGAVFWYGSRDSEEPIPGRRLDVVLRYPGGKHIFALDTGTCTAVIDSVSAESWAHILRSTGGMLAQWGVPELFSPKGHRAFGPRMLALGESSRFEIRLRDSSGVLQRILRVAREPELVTDAHLDAIRNLIGTPASLSPVDLAMQYLSEVPTGGPIPFFSELRFDDAGRLWIADYIPSPELVIVDELRWTIFDENLLPVAHMTTGPSGNILEMGDDYVLLVERDEMDVQRVAMYRIEQG